MAPPDANNRKINKLEAELKNLRDKLKNKNNANKLLKMVGGGLGYGGLGALGLGGLGLGGYGYGGQRKYEVKEGPTGFFNGKLRRFFFSPEVGFFIKIYNPRTRKLVSVPTRGLFRWQNVGNKIVRYKARRQLSSRAPPRSQAKLNEFLGSQRGLAGYRNNEDPRHKYRYSYT
jgi:hypothetical protein